MTIFKTKYVLQVEGSSPPRFLIVGDGETADKNKASRMYKHAALRFVEAGRGQVFNRRWPIDDEGIFEF